MSADADTAWYEQIGLAEDIETHAVEPERFADVHAQPDGSVVFDEGWGGAWIESDTVAEVVR